MASGVGFAAARFAVLSSQAKNPLTLIYRGKEQGKWLGHIVRGYFHPGVFMVKIGYERYGQQVDLEVIKDMMMRENNDFPIEELNTPRKGRHSKSDRISRLEPDIREGRFYLPCVAYHGDFGKAGEHICYWSVWTQKHNENAAAIEEKHAHSVGQVTYRPMKGLTKAQERCVLTAQKHRIVTALQRRDENGDIYDLRAPPPHDGGDMRLQYS
jgi:hypothetical protein